MTILWVQFKQLDPAAVSADGCSHVYGFLKVCKKEMPHNLGAYDVSELRLTSADRTFLSYDAVPEENTGENPYRITVPRDSGTFQYLTNTESHFKL
jgi:hypothetical protein